MLVSDSAKTFVAAPPIADTAFWIRSGEISFSTSVDPPSVNPASADPEVSGTFSGDFSVSSMTSCS